MRALSMSLMLAMTPLAAQAGELPGWIAGAWVERNGESWSEEFWSGPRGGILLGAARTGKGTALEFWEQTRIQIDPDGSIAFYASPKGARAARFAIESQSATEIVFANAAHDYPQRIRYWRDGKLLKAEISKIDGSDKQGWSYAPMGE
jgi:hypothetical protein